MRILNVIALALIATGVLSAGSLTIGNSGFETPDISVGLGGCTGTITGGTYIYQPAGCGAVWTFEGGTGLTRNSSAFGNIVGPDASLQAAFVQGASEFSQGIAGIEVGGVYTISFYAVQRACCDGSFGQTISVSFGNQVLTFGGGASTSVHPVTDGWTRYTTDAFVAQNGSDVLQFTGNYSGGDATAFVDVVSSDEAGVAPEPETWGLLAGGLALMTIRRLRRPAFFA